MKLLLAAIVLFLIVETNAQYKFPGQAVQGSRDMLSFNGRRNSDVSREEQGNGRAADHLIKDRDRADIAKDQEANRWGRNGGNPNRYWPLGFPSRYYEG